MSSSTPSFVERFDLAMNSKSFTSQISCSAIRSNSSAFRFYSFSDDESQPPSKGISRIGEWGRVHACSILQHGRHKHSEPSWGIPSPPPLGTPLPPRHNTTVDFVSKAILSSNLLSFICGNGCENRFLLG